MVSSTVEKLTPTRVKLTITVNPEDLKPAIEQAYTEISKQVTIPGFRAGKVPPPIIDQRVGRGPVLEQAVNEGLDDFYRQALQEHELGVIGRPTAEVTALPEVKDFSGDLIVDVEVDVRPEVTVPDYEGITVVVDAQEVDAAAVDQELDRLRGRFGTLLPLDRPLKKGDFAELNMVARIDGAEVDRAENVSYELGSGELLEGIDEAIDSLTAGEETTFRSTLIGGDHAGKEAEVSVDVVSVKERELPDADDDFAQMASEFDTITELRQSLEEQVGQQSRAVQASAAREKFIDHLLEKANIPVPDNLIAEQVDEQLASEERSADTEHRATVTAAAQRQFRVQMILDALVTKLAVQTSQEEVSQYIVQSAAQYGMAPQEFADALQQSGQLMSVFADVSRNKALALALGTVTVVDTADAPVDMTGFVATVDESSEGEAEDDDKKDKPKRSAGTKKKKK